MTVTTSISNVSYPNASGTGPYAFSFRVMLASQLVVTSATTANPPVVTTLVNGTDYTVTGLTNRNGGSVTLINAPVGGPTITIARIVPLVQLADFRNQGEFFPENYEDALDYVTWMCQEIASSGGTLVINTGGGAVSAGPWINVTAAPYNAKGDGVTDDTAAFNAVMTAIQTAGGGVCYAPGGKTYIINPDYQGGASVRMVSNATLWLERGATLKAKAFSGTTGAVVYAASVSNIGIRGGGVIDGNRAGHSGGGEDVHCIECGTVNRAFFEDVTCQNAWGDGLNLEGNGGGAPGTENLNIVAHRVTFTNNYRNGVSCQSLKTARFVECDFNSSNGTAPQAGIDMEPEVGGCVVQDVEVVGCHGEGNAGVGASITTTAQECKIIGGVWRNNTTGGLYVNGAAGFQGNNQIIAPLIEQNSNTSYGINLEFDTAVQVVAPRIYGTFLYGIWVRGGASYATGRHVISDVHITGDNATASIGIQIENNAGRCQVTGGQIELTGTGVYITNSSFQTIEGLTVRLTLTIGVRISQGEHIALRGSFVDEAGTIGVSLESSAIAATVQGCTIYGSGSQGIFANTVTDPAILGNRISSSNQRNNGSSEVRIDTCTAGQCLGNVCRKGILAHVAAAGIILTGSSNVQMKDNDVNDAFATAGIIIASDAGSIVEDNPGFNPVGTTGTGVGASPAIITNGPTKATLYLSGGTITKCTINGDDVSGAGNQQIQLAAYQAVTITHTGAPTAFLDVH